jgi:hypothetical protein
MQFRQIIRNDGSVETVKIVPHYIELAIIQRTYIKSAASVTYNLTKRYPSLFPALSEYLNKTINRLPTDIDFQTHRDPMFDLTRVVARIFVTEDEKLLLALHGPFEPDDQG